MLAMISFAILFSYTAYYLSRVGLLPSHSDSYLALGKQGWMLQVSLFLTAFLLMIPLLEITPDPFKFTAFFTCAPVLFTAFAPDFRKENGKVTMERKVHMMGANLSGYCGIKRTIPVGSTQSFLKRKSPLLCLLMDR